MYIKIGKNFSKNILINEKILRKYISFSGDTNPIHTNKLTAKNYGFQGIVVHGGIIVALISKIKFFILKIISWIVNFASSITNARFQTIKSRITVL